MNQMFKEFRLRSRMALIACGAAASLCAGAANAASEKVALVIGNAAYKNVPVLENPLVDSAAISASLKRLGFDVVEGYDLKLEAMRQTVGEFAGKLDGAKVALVYYAGHGVSVAGENYLLPTDTVLKTEADLDFRTMNISLVLRQMQRDERVNIVILDACRDNPFKEELSRGLKTRSAAVSNGLSEISAKSAAGTLIAFATDPGMTALDGTKGENSPFAAALLKHIESPGVPVSAVMDRVRENVWNATAKKQRPWVNTSIIGEFYLASPPAAPMQVASLDPAAPIPAANLAAAPVMPQALEMKLWESAEKSDVADDYKAYLSAHPNGYFAQIAKNRIARLSGGGEAATARTVSDADLKAEVGTAKTETAVGWAAGDKQQAQRRLKALGFDPGKISADFKPNARKAVADWQKSRAIAETGYFTKVQRTALWEQSEAEYGKIASAAPAERSVRQPRTRAAERGERAPRERPAGYGGQPQRGPSMGEVGMFLGGAGSLIGAIRR